MATIGSLGVGSGIDLSSILTQLMAIERRPLQQVQQRQSAIQAQISAYGSLKSAISTFQTAAGEIAKAGTIKQYSTSSSDETVLTATASSSAAKGTFDITVTDLAKAHKVASMRYADSDTTTVGTGTLDITVNGSTMNLTVDSSNNTLQGLRNAINSDSNNPGVTASIITEGGGKRLVLTSEETGADYAMTITPSAGLGDIFNTGSVADGHAETVSTAQDAAFSIDNFSVTSSSNTVTDIIEGVTLNLKDQGTSTIKIDRDDEAVTSAVQSFVDAYNALRSEIDSLRDGAIGNDSTLGRIERAFLNVFNTEASLTGSYTNLFQVGISRDKYGVVQFDSSDLTDALSSNFDDVVALFTDSTEGFGTRFEAAADDLLDFGGILESREDGLNDRLDSLRDQAARMEIRLEEVQSRYVQRFSALDTTMSQLNSTSSFLNSQMLSLI